MFSSSLITNHQEATIEATRWQYTHGVKNENAISSDNWFLDQSLLDRPVNKEIQLKLFYDYSSNPNPGHFALEEEGELIADLISRFLTTRKYPVARILTAG